MTEREHLSFFINRTKARRDELLNKRATSRLTRAEIFELDMCEGDLKRAEEEIQRLRRQDEQRGPS